MAIQNSTSNATDTNPAANDFVGRFHIHLSRAKDALHRAQQQQRKCADQRRRHAEFSVGDQVLLSTQHLTLQVHEGPTPNLCPRYIGPFSNIKILSPVAYQLKLQRTMKCHNVFHVSLLKIADTTTTMFDRDLQPPPPPVQVDNGEAYFVVENIMSHEPKTATSHTDTKKYLIKWEGYPLWEATKEPARNIAKGVPHLVQE
jgi:hypothetical protein